MLTVTGVPPGGTVKVVKSNPTIASGTVGPDGKATIDLGKFHFPLNAAIGSTILMANGSHPLEELSRYGAATSTMCQQTRQLHLPHKAWSLPTA